MQFIVVATRSESHSPEDFAPYLQPESKKALELWSEGVARQIWSRTDGKGAVIEVEARDEDEVRARLGELPLAQKGMLTFEIYGVAPYRGIGMAAEKL